jgi:hypothetical protein
LNSKSNFYHSYHCTNYFPREYVFTACHDHWILFFKPERFGFKARGLQDTWPRLLIFRIYSKSKQGRFKNNVTLSLILRFNQRLGGYSIWSAIFHRTPYHRSNSENEHLIASMQPRKYSKKNFKTELQKKPKTTSEVLEELVVLSYEELGGLSDPGLRDCVHNVVHTGIGDRTCLIPYLCCTLLACEVELVDTEGSYLSCTRVRFLG